MIALTRPHAAVYVPDGTDVDAALARTTHLGIGAHADDLELMAWEPIIHCVTNDNVWFTAVTVSDGRGSPRKGEFAAFSDEQMREARLEEQQAAARLGRYSTLLCLDYPSDEIRQRGNLALRDDLREVIKFCHPRFVYTHNPVDKHDTHTALAVAVIEALRQLAPEDRPERLYGCEVWRGLDWLVDEDKTNFDVTAGITVMEHVMSVFQSQIAGGKRYDLAAVGRKRANATYLSPHDVDHAGALEYALDMTELLEQPQLSIGDFVRRLIDRFARDVGRRLEPYT